MQIQTIKARKMIWTNVKIGDKIMVGPVEIFVDRRVKDGIRLAISTDHDLKIEKIPAANPRLSSQDDDFGNLAEENPK